MVAAETELSLTGTYDDGGTVVTRSEGAPGEEVSLHALLTVEFTPGLARLLHERTGQVRLRHVGAALEVDIVKRDGEIGWQRSWKEGDGYALRDNSVVLHFKPLRAGRDEFVLILKTITVHRLLQVEVQRLTPTLLGPSIHPVGTYLFGRLPEEKETVAEPD